MPLTPAQELKLPALYRSLKDAAIEPGHPYYVKIWEGTPYDPVKRMCDHITWTEVESLQLFSGFSGSGKSTQLQRLKKELEKAGYFVIYANAEHYMNLGETTQITDLLLAVAGAFSDGLKREGKDLLAESYWTRLLHYLNTTVVEIGEITAMWDVVQLKASLKETPSFRQKVQAALAGRISELSRGVRAFVEEGVKAISKGGEVRVVFLFDSMEKNRGTPSNSDEVMNGLERIFGSHLDLLKLPWVHCVYAVPAWLKFIKPDAPIVLIPSIRQWNNDPERTPYQPGWDALRRVMRSRFKDEGCNLLFGPPDASGLHPEAERLIAECGGSLRDLFGLFGETIRAVQAEPVSKAVTRAIDTERNNFRTNIEDAHWLKKIGEERAADPPTSDKRDLHRFMRLLETHFVLYFKNDTDWYDTHPLVRAEVERIVRSNPEPETA